MRMHYFIILLVSICFKSSFLSDLKVSQLV